MTEDYDEYQPMDFGECIDSLKDQVQHVTKRYEERIEELTKKLEAVSDYASRVAEMEAEHADCIKQLEIEKDKLHRETFDAITSKFQVEYYKPRRRGEHPPKCDMCDDLRQVYHESPLTGNLIKEICPNCGSPIDTYTPEITILRTFYFTRNGNKELCVIPTYKRVYDGFYEVEGDYRKVVREGDNMPDIDTEYQHCNEEYMFESREMCDEFCERLTEHYSKEASE